MINSGLPGVHASSWTNPSAGAPTSWTRPGDGDADASWITPRKRRSGNQGCDRAMNANRTNERIVLGGSRIGDSAPGAHQGWTSMHAVTGVRVMWGLRRTRGGG